MLALVRSGVEVIVPVGEESWVEPLRLLAEREDDIAVVEAHRKLGFGRADASQESLRRRMHVGI
ncbi:hypothetical protein F8O01_15270 [Pseudoclavibacter chungangensis]|uniref:Uncharacterized protein n=1 Tax=Pseudoclavibacter chungangensis TaxID=587635 RepID=A0A7J5BNT2_9MICO|nr:hypothetical protein [Pseudoclavibacter chungangensis]KAB1653428.1 hypothetical protein F8O01_15270 [Pseudoclavibacter chungangensis]NYJ66364.1 hypothetical protein [Pseudoclavibacter chungangensis]